jgi:hypothetical protein
MDLQLACRKHRENQIRGSGPVSPAASCRCYLLSLTVETDCRIPATTEGREPSEVSPVTSCRCYLLSLSVETDCRIPATTEGREPSIAPVEPGPDRAPSFVDSISDNIDYGTNLATNGSSQQPPSMGTGASAFTPNAHISQQTTTETSTGTCTILWVY